MGSAKPSVRYEVSFVPQWEDIERIRMSLGLCLEAVLRDPTLREAVSMVGSELLENAVKHSGRPSEPVAFLLVLQDGELSLTVGNSYEPSDGRGTELRATIEWIGTFDDPQEAYTKKMQEIFESEPRCAGGLGLVRVAYEGRCHLACSLNPEVGRLEVKARFSR